MNLVEIYDYKLEELLEREKRTRDRIKELDGDLNQMKESLRLIYKEKQELQEDLDDNLRFWSRE